MAARNGVARQRLGEDVCSLFCSWNEQRCNEAAVHSIAKPEEAQVEVLHATMMLWVAQNGWLLMSSLEGDCRL